MIGVPKDSNTKRRAFRWRRRRNLHLCCHFGLVSLLSKPVVVLLVVAAEPVVVPTAVVAKSVVASTAVVVVAVLLRGDDGATLAPNLTQ